MYPSISWSCILIPSSIDKVTFFSSSSAIAVLVALSSWSVISNFSWGASRVLGRHVWCVFRTVFYQCSGRMLRQKSLPILLKNLFTVHSLRYSGVFAVFLLVFLRTFFACLLLVCFCLFLGRGEVRRGPGGGASPPNGHRQQPDVSWFLFIFPCFSLFVLMFFPLFFVFAIVCYFPRCT